MIFSDFCLSQPRSIWKLFVLSRENLRTALVLTYSSANKHVHTFFWIAVRSISAVVLLLENTVWTFSNRLLTPYVSCLFIHHDD